MEDDIVLQDNVDDPEVGMEFGTTTELIEYFFLSEKKMEGDKCSPWSQSLLGIIREVGFGLILFRPRYFQEYTQAN